MLSSRMTLWEISTDRHEDGGVEPWKCTSQTSTPRNTTDQGLNSSPWKSMVGFAPRPHLPHITPSQWPCATGTLKQAYSWETWDSPDGWRPWRLCWSFLRLHGGLGCFHPTSSPSLVVQWLSQHLPAPSLFPITEALLLTHAFSNV